MTATIPRSAERFIEYLNQYGGSETTTFTDNEDKPDIEKARVFAEKLRLTHKKYVNELISIEQKYNKVTISVIT